MFAGGSRRKAKNPARVGIFVRQPAIDKPVENAIEGHPVERRGAERQFDLVVRQRRWRSAQQEQNANTRGRRARAGASNMLGDKVDSDRG